MQRLLPPQLTLILAGLMVAFDTFLPGPELVPAPVYWLGLPLLAMGLAITVVARVQFVRARTNIYTFRAPDCLVTDGMFRFTRNPMYLGFSAALAGLSLFLGTLPGMLLAVAFVIISDRWYIAFEEEMLRARFGEHYLRYAQRTRRWL